MYQVVVGEEDQALMWAWINAAFPYTTLLVTRCRDLPRVHEVRANHVWVYILFDAFNQIIAKKIAPRMKGKPQSQEVNLQFSNDLFPY